MLPKILPKAHVHALFKREVDPVCLVGILWQSGDGGTNICYNIGVISNGISLGSPQEKEEGIKTDRNKLV